MKIFIGIFLVTLSFLIFSFNKKENNPSTAQQFIEVLGIAQDAGYPQIGCTKQCCADYWSGKETKKYVSCLALVDNETNEYWLFDATPNITEQLQMLQSSLQNKNQYSPTGIFLTHAHMGHYTGLMYLGREAMNTKSVPVYAMPRMKNFLETNGPWNQLVHLKNIEIHPLVNDSMVAINKNFSVKPLLVPHRDEYSETVGYIVQSKKKKVLFIPDIDKWEKWNKNIVDEIEKVDFAFIDGTFYQNGELPGRNMNEVPHPFVEESIRKFSGLSAAEKSKIYFTHFNHTNPLLKNKSPEKDRVKQLGFNVAEEKMKIAL
ncbi:MAG: MBL fold metallo-hydrolase [Sphingobacteriia bacterium]|nr:MBL fold metallo-hydrolase [Sphingobacteriia bacterium]